MKTALCISGLPRFFDKGYPYLYENLIEPLAPDIFISTWEDNNKEELIKYEKLYQPINFEVELLDGFKSHDFTRYHSKTTNCRPKNMICLNYKVYRCNKLKSIIEKVNGFKYDLVIKARADIAIGSKITNDEIQDAKNNIWFTDALPNFGRFVSDLIYFSNSETMDNVCDFYPHIDEYYDMGVVLDPEITFTHHIQKNQIRYKKKDWPWRIIKK